MKELADGTQVSSRTYYYLLEFNDKTNWEFIRCVLKKEKLHELNKVEYARLFKHATTEDLQKLKTL